MLKHAAQPLVTVDLAVSRLRLNLPEQFVVKSLARAVAKIVANRLANQMRQVAFAEDDQPIEALVLDRLNPAAAVNQPAALREPESSRAGLTAQLVIPVNPARSGS